jgi:hypothetical protein
MEDQKKRNNFGDLGTDGWVVIDLNFKCRLYDDRKRIHIIEGIIHWPDLLYTLMTSRVLHKTEKNFTS